jgi:hypothetical protein
MKRLALIALTACTTPASDVDPLPGGKADGAAGTRGLPAELPSWGGDDPARWSPEAILANAVTTELARDPGARVSIPTALWASQHAPFGDGQTNAATAFVHWQGPRPPVVGTRHPGGRVTVRFDRALPVHDGTFELWTPHGQWVRSVAAARTAEGDWRIELAELPPQLAMRMVVSPRGWRDGFPLAFDLPITSVGALASTLPAGLRQLPGGEPVVDPVAAAEAATGTTTAFDVLRGSTFPAGFVNQHPFVTDSVHAAFPQGGPPRITAVGGAWTWVAEQPFKNLYVCFDERSPAREAEYGVPSGSGWHHVGDAGETMLSTLEDAPLLVGHASAIPIAPPTGGGHAYGLDRATTYALLQPGQAFTTPRGDFHWYAVHHASKPCVQLWVHRCEPDPAAPGMACAGD